MKTKYLDWTKMYILSKLIRKTDNYIYQKIRIPETLQMITIRQGVYTATQQHAKFNKRKGYQRICEREAKCTKVIYTFRR